MRWSRVHSLPSCAYAILSSILSLALQNAVAEQAVTADASIEEVIVTVRKIEEDARRVPMSLQVLTSDYLADWAPNHLYNLQFSIPGYVVRNLGVFGANNALRGVSAATHLDGVYQGTSNLAITRLFDLERIEVIKGPQGTLYGGNATGGSINIVTHAPEEDFSAEVAATRGSFDLTRVNGHVNLPFDNGAFRLAAIASAGDGYIRNTVDGRRFAEDDFYGVRASLGIAPTDYTNLQFTIQHVFDDGASGDLWVPRKDFLVDPHDIRLTTVTLEDPFLESVHDNASATLEAQLDFATLRWISGYARSEERNRDDCAGVPRLAGCVREIIPLRHTQWTQEIQLISEGGAKFDWLLGAYYLSSDRSYNYLLNVPLVSPLPQNDQTNTSKDHTMAVFGQARIYPAEDWEVTGGLRLSRSAASASIDGTGWADPASRVSATDDWVDVSWRLDTTYELSDGFLVYASASTGFNRGGITTRQLSSGRTSALDSFDPEYLTAFEIGAKLVSDDGRGRLEAALFYYVFRDMQLTTRTFVGNTFVSIIDNAAEAELYGIDAAFDLELTSRLSFSSAVVWTPKREFVEYRNEVTGDILSGNQLPLTSEWSTSTSLNYQLPVGNLGILSAALEYNFRSHFFFTEENSSTLAQDDFGLLNARLGFESATQKWYLFAAARNIGDKDYFTQVFLQSAPGYPDTYEVGVGMRL